jgi:hypothetical protein
MDLPVGWTVAGLAPRDYEFAIDRTEHHSGTSSAVVRARTPTPGGFGTLMQVLLADDYLGSRVRLSAFIQTRDVTGWCGLWLRIDDPDRRVLAFDNMQTRPIQGTTAWARYEVVLDVAEAAAGLSFGLLLDGGGAVWLDEVALEVVGTDVPTTVAPVARHPRNLDFEEPV